MFGPLIAQDMEGREMDDSRNTVLSFDATAADKELIRLEAAARSLTSALGGLHQHGVSLGSSADVVKAGAVQDAIRARVAAFPECVSVGYFATIWEQYKAAMRRYSANISPDSFTFNGPKVQVSEAAKAKIKAKYTVYATDEQEALLQRLQSVADEINAIGETLRRSHSSVFSVVGPRPSLIEFRGGKAVVSKQTLQFVRVLPSPEEETKAILQEFSFLTA